MRTVIAILTGGHYGNTCFTILVGFVLEGVGVLVFVMFTRLRFPACSANLGLTDRIAFGVVTVGIAALSYVVVIACTLQSAGRTFIYLNAVFKSCFVGVGIRRNIIVSAVMGVRPALLTASTAINLKITVARAILGEIVVCYTASVMAIIRPFAYVVAITADFFYGNTCFTVLVCFIQECVGVLIFVVSVIMRFFGVRTDLYLTHRKGVGVVTVGVAAFVFIMAISRASQAAGGALIYGNRMLNTVLVNVGIARDRVH